MDVLSFCVSIIPEILNVGSKHRLQTLHYFSASKRDKWLMGKTLCKVFAHLNQGPVIFDNWSALSHSQPELSQTCRARHCQAVRLCWDVLPPSWPQDHPVLALGYSLCWLPSSRATHWRGTHSQGIFPVLPFPHFLSTTSLPHIPWESKAPGISVMLE